MLENQIAQQTSSSSEAGGKLPSQPEMNPREHCKVVALRSGRTLVQPEVESIEETVEKSKDQAEKKEEEAKKDKEEEARKTKKLPEPYQPPLHFPQKFQKAKLDKQFGKFLEVLQKLYINIPFTEALSQMPSYAKFLKEILSKKRKLEDYGTGALTEEYKALCDLGASVSLMPLSICKKLEIGKLKPTTISLQLADRSIKYPVGILENIPIKVGKFFIPVDFVVLEMEEDVQIPIILGRPFLATVGAIIDAKNG
ncbi:hypothetical protein P3X46_009139 [Hevea brasiliensis]|uniref:Aspartic peptidase DDI1-type domain-containing protein n=1 Tax=Hevea brasiliensis TaxID=3981 RepID=A0ABQ9MKY3_HEVBR|nr:hypothetical protein P3X46_009139 [Hevea brasiliensis]